MKSKFDYNTLVQDRKRLDSIEANVIKVLYDQGTQTLTSQQVHQMMEDFRGVINVAAMYNQVIEEYVKDGCVTTSDPQKYITQRLP